MTRMTLILLLGFSLLMSFSAEAGNKHRHHGKKHHKHHYYTLEDRRHVCRFERHYRDGRHARSYDRHYRELGIEYGYWYPPGETVVVFHSPTLSIGFRN